MSSFYVKHNDKVYYVATYDGTTFVYKQCTGVQPMEGSTANQQSESWHLGDNILVQTNPNRSFAYRAELNTTISSVEDARKVLSSLP